jgi:hypothetical protein
MEMAQPCALLGRPFSPRLVNERGWPIFRPRVYIGLSASSPTRLIMCCRMNSLRPLPTRLETDGEEIGDECSFLLFTATDVFFDPNLVRLNRNSYAIQPEYVNSQHACSTSASDGD